MSQAAEVCLLNKVMSKELEEGMSLKECTFLLNPAYQLLNAGFSFLRNCKLTLGQQWSSNEVVSLLLPFISTFDNVWQSPAFSLRCFNFSNLCSDRSVEESLFQERKKTPNPHIQEGGKDERGISGVFLEFWGLCYGAAVLLPWLSWPVQLLSRRESIESVLGCKPAHQCLMPLCAVWIYSDTTVDELHTEMPVKTVRITLILFCEIYFMKFTYP